MGERTWVEIITFPSNKEGIEKIMEEPPEMGWDEDKDWAPGWNPDLVAGVFTEVNYGINTELFKQLEKSGMTLLASAGSYPGCYGAHAVAFRQGKGIEVRSDDDGMPVVGFHNGEVNESELAQCRRFEESLFLSEIRVEEDQE